MNENYDRNRINKAIRSLVKQKRSQIIHKINRLQSYENNTSHDSNQRPADMTKHKPNAYKKSK